MPLRNLTRYTLRVSKHIPHFGVRDLAKHLRMSEWWVRRNVRLGKLGHYKVGAAYRFTNKMIIDFLKGRPALLGSAPRTKRAPLSVKEGLLCR